jgi:hypothetical protein
MKLVFRSGIGGNDIPIKLSDTSSVPVKWCTLHWVPTEEDWRKRFLLFKYYRQPKWIPNLYSEFATLCMPDGGITYAVLSPVWGLAGFDGLRKSLEEAGLHSYEMDGKTLIAELDREHVPMVFEEGSWQVNRLYLFISRQKISDWLERLKETSELRGFNYRLLENLEAIVSNFWEHGIEAVSANMSIDSLRDIAGQVSDKLRVPLEIKENMSLKKSKDRLSDEPAS